MAANNKFKEEDTYIINLFKELQQKNGELKEETNDFTNIKTIIDKLKNKYIEKIITFKIGYEKKDLEKNSITKLQEIYTNYKEYNDNNCKNISFRSGVYNENTESSLLILLVALFNKKNYILTKLFDEQYYNKNTSEDINNIIEKLNKYIKMYLINISNKETIFVNLKDIVLNDKINLYCMLLLKTQYKTSEDMRYLTELQIYIDTIKDETNFYNLLYLIQDKLMKFPKNICDTNNITNKYNNKIFYNVSYNTNELNIKDLNTDDKLKLNVLLENGTIEEVIIKKIPLIFININKKYKADNPIKTFLETIYEIYEGFIQLFDDYNEVNKIIEHDYIYIYIHNILSRFIFINKYIEIYKNKLENHSNYNDFKSNIEDALLSNYNDINQFINKNDAEYISMHKISSDNINSLNSNKSTGLDYALAIYDKKLLNNLESLFANFKERLNSLSSLYYIHSNIKIIDNYKFECIEVYSNIIDINLHKLNTIQANELLELIKEIRTANKEFKIYIDYVEKIIDDDISDGLNSFEQFTDTELSGLQVDIKPEKVSFGQTLEIGDNVLYLNSIVIKHKMTPKYNDYIYICIYECNGKWYMYDCKRPNNNVKLIGNDFNEMYTWKGFKTEKPFVKDYTTEETAVEEDYVQNNVVGLFYT
jgi:hypothetical protein